MHHRDAGELRSDECRPARTNAIPGAASLSPVDVDERVAEKPRQLPRQLAVPTQVEARGHREPGRGVALPGGAGAAVVQEGGGAFRAVDGGPEASVEEVTDPADELRERQRVWLVDPPRQ